MATISLKGASSLKAPPALRARTRVSSAHEDAGRHNPAKGVLVGLAAGAGLWVALLAGFGVL